MELKEGGVGCAQIAQHGAPVFLSLAVSNQVLYTPLFRRMKFLRLSTGGTERLPLVQGLD